MIAARVHYFEGQTVDAALLGGGQDWFDAGLARHERANHPWGLICGLEPGLSEDGGLWLAPGAARDADGRSLCMAEPLRLTPPETAADTLDLWLRRVTAAGETPGRRRLQAQPFAYPATGEDADPDQPRDPEGRTAVYLGRLRRENGSWRPLTTRRRPIGLTAGRLADPGGTATLTLGATGSPESRGLEIGSGAGGPALMSASPAGALNLSGPLAVPALTLGGAGLALAEPREEPPPRAAPWTLRVAPGALILEPPAGGRLVIGGGGGAAFRPILGVSASGDVEIRGELTAGGAIRQAPVPADAADPRFIEALLAAIKAIPPVLAGGASAPKPDANGSGA